MEEDKPLHNIRKFIKDIFKVTYKTNEKQFSLKQDIWDAMTPEDQEALTNKTMKKISDDDQTDDYIIYKAIKSIKLDDATIKDTLFILDIRNENSWQIIPPSKKGKKWGDAKILGDSNEIKTLTKEGTKLIKNDSEYLTLLYIAVEELRAENEEVFVFLGKKFEGGKNKPSIVPDWVVEDLLKNSSTKRKKILKELEGKSSLEKLIAQDGLWIKYNNIVVTKVSAWFGEIATEKLSKIRQEFLDNEKPVKPKRQRKKFTQEEEEVSEAKYVDKEETWKKISGKGINCDDKKREGIINNLFKVLRVTKGKALSANKNTKIPKISTTKPKYYFNLTSQRTIEIKVIKTHIYNNYIFSDVPAGNWFRSPNREFSVNIAVARENFHVTLLDPSEKGRSQKNLTDAQINRTATEMLTYVYGRFMTKCFEDINLLSTEENMPLSREEKFEALEGFETQDVEMSEKTEIGRVVRQLGIVSGIDPFLINQLGRIPEDVRIPGEGGNLPEIEQPEKEKEFGPLKILGKSKKNDELLALEKELAKFNREEKDALEIIQSKQDFEDEDIEKFEDTTFVLETPQRTKKSKLLQVETRIRPARNKIGNIDIEEQEFD